MPEYRVEWSIEAETDDLEAAALPCARDPTKRRRLSGVFNVWARMIPTIRPRRPFARNPAQGPSPVRQRRRDPRLPPLARRAPDLGSLANSTTCSPRHATGKSDRTGSTRFPSRPTPATSGSRSLIFWKGGPRSSRERAATSIPSPGRNSRPDSMADNASPSASSPAPDEALLGPRFRVLSADQGARMPLTRRAPEKSEDETCQPPSRRARVGPGASRPCPPRRRPARNRGLQKGLEAAREDPDETHPRTACVRP